MANTETSTNVAKEEQHGQAVAEKAANDDKLGTVDLTQLPSMPRVAGLAVGRGLSPRLSAEDLSKAEQISKSADLEDLKKIIDFGQRQQTDSKKTISFVGQLIREEAKVMELGEVGRLATEFKEKLKEIGVGDLRTAWWEDALRSIPWLGPKFDRVAKFMEKYEKVTDQLETILRNMTKEKVEMDELYGKAEQIQKVNEQALDNLMLAAAALEIKLTETETRNKESMEKYRGKPELTRDEMNEVRAMRRTEDALLQRLVAVKLQGVESENAMRQMDTLMDAMLQSRDMLQTQTTLQESIWRNQINAAILERKVAGVNTMIKESRSFTEKLIKANQDNIASTVTELKQLAGEPAVAMSVVKGVIDAQTQLEKTLLEIGIQNKKKLQDAAGELDKMREQIRKDNADLQQMMIRQEEEA